MVSDTNGNAANGTFKYNIPDWFLSRCITVFSTPDFQRPKTFNPDNYNNNSHDAKEKSYPKNSSQETKGSGDAKDSAELLDMARGLLVYDEKTGRMVPESVMLLRSKSKTGEAAWPEYLEQVVRDLAREMGAAMITLSLQDLENLAVDLYNQELQWNKTHDLCFKAWSPVRPEYCSEYPMTELYFSGMSRTRTRMALSAIWLAAQEQAERDAVSQLLVAKKSFPEPNPSTSDLLPEYVPRCNPPVLFHVRNAEELAIQSEEVASGQNCLFQINEWIRLRRREGQKMALVCCTSVQEKWYRDVFRWSLEGKACTAVVIEPPPPIKENRETKAARIRRLNIWKLQRRLQARCPQQVKPDLLHPFADWPGLSEQEHEAMGQREWCWDSLDRAQVQIPGRPVEGQLVDVDDIWTVLRRLGFFDMPVEEEQPEVEKQSEGGKSPQETWSAKVEKMAGDCNKFESRLLENVVDPTELQITWDDVILDHDTKDTMMQLVAMSRFRPKATSSFMLKNIRINGALLYGPPGTGKTHLCRAIAQASGSNMLSLDSAALQSKWVGESEKYVRAAFTLAEKLHPCVLFMDEVDAMFYRRSSDDKDWQRRSLTQFLTGMDGLSKSGNAPFVLVATNRPWDLDEAFLRRLPQKVFFRLPDEDCRRRILGTFVGQDDLSSEVDLAEVAKATEGYSGSDLRSVCAQAGLSWSMDQVRNEGVDKMSESTELKLTEANFTRAIRMVRPSNATHVPPEMLSFVERFNPDVLAKHGKGLA